MGYRNGGHQGCYSHNHECVEGVASHDIADCQVGRSLERTDKAHAELWHRGAHGHYGQTNNELGDMKALGKPHCAVGELVSSP